MDYEENLISLKVIPSYLCEDFKIVHTEELKLLIISTSASLLGQIKTSTLNFTITKEASYFTITIDKKQERLLRTVLLFISSGVRLTCSY